METTLSKKTHDSTRLDWREIVTLLNLNKFVCITCEPSRPEYTAFPIFSATYTIFDSPHLRTKPFQHVLHRVSIDTRAHTQTHRVGTVYVVDVADKINHLPNSWQNFHAHSIWFLSDFWWNEGKNVEHLNLWKSLGKRIQLNREKSVQNYT